MRLERLEIVGGSDGCRVLRDAHAVHLAGALRDLSDHLVELRLKETAFGERGWQEVLAAAGECRKLRKMDLQSALGIREIDRMQHAMGHLAAGLTALEELDLLERQFDDEGYT